MTTRITGMNSGLDTEALITELVKAKSVKVDSLTKKKTSLEWKQDAWKDLNKEVKSLYSAFGNMRYSSAYMKKSATASNPNAVSIIAGDGAMNSVQTLSIKKLASTGYLTGAVVSTADGTKATASTKLSELLFGTDSFSGSGSINITSGGETHTVEFDENTTISNFVSALNGAGVSANFDEKNQRLFVGAKTSGADADFTITANDGNANMALSVLGINAAPTENTIREYEKLSGYSSLMVTAGGEFDAAATVEAIQNEGVTSDIYKRLMGLAKSNFQAEVDAQKAIVDGKNQEIKDLEKEISDLEGTDTSAFTEDDLTAHNAAIEEKKALLEQKKTDLEPDTATLTSMQEDMKNGIYSVASMEQAATSLNNQIQYAATAATSTDTSMYNTGAVRLSGEDAEIELNGATFTGASNNIEVNGLTFNCKAVEDNIVITTQDDTDGIYDMVKDFFKKYNDIIIKMDKMYNAESSKGYEPLTDDEKDAMTDKEIEKWEEKIKNSILRKDSNLNTLFNTLKDSMAMGFEVNGKNMYLSDFGIETLGYFDAEEFEHAAYHIAGDPDDSATSGNPDKLKTMIATDPEAVVSFFTQLSANLYDKLSEISASSTYSSYGSFYDDKQMKTDLSDYAVKILEAEEKLQDYEDKYYDKFSAMETALASLQSKTNYVSQLFSM